MEPRFRHFLVAAICAFLSMACTERERVLTPEETLSGLLNNPRDRHESSLDDDYSLVGSPTYKIRTAQTQAPSHYATVTGTLNERGAVYRFTFTAFCKDGVWYFDPDGAMLLEQPSRSWSSADPRYALHQCKMAATWCLGFKN